MLNSCKLTIGMPGLRFHKILELFELEGALNAICTNPLHRARTLTVPSGAQVSHPA